MRYITTIVLFLLALPAWAEVVDAIDGTRTGGSHIYRAAESPAPFQNDDAFTICTFFNSGNTGQNTIIATLASDGDNHAHLSGIRHDNTGILQLRDNFTNLDSSVAAISQDTWYAACLRSAGTGSMTLSYYNSGGTLIEDLTGTDTNDPSFGTPDELRIVFGGLYRANTDDTVEFLENGVALMSIWTSDIGDSGADSYASDPLNYTGTTNPPDFFKAHDNNGDITISTTLQDQSGNGKHFTLAGDAALSDEGGPTVTDFSGAPEFTSGPQVTAGGPTLAKWPTRGNWLNYDGSVFGPNGLLRLGDRGEAILARILANKYRSITDDYEFRQFEYTNMVLLPPGEGDCLEGFIPEGARLYVVMGAQPEPGDLVLVKFSERTRQAFNYFAERGFPGVSYQPPGHLSVKIYSRMHGREILMNAGAAFEVADTQILGVVRYADIDGTLAYMAPDDPGPPLQVSGRGER